MLTAVEMAGTSAGIRHTLRESVRFQRDNVSLAAGLRSAAALVLVLSIGLAWLGTTAGVSMGAGALVVGLGGRASGLRVPSLTMSAIALAVAVSTFVGSVTGRETWLHALVLAAWAAGAGLASALSTSAAVVGLQALVALVVFGRFPESVAGASRLVGFILAGAAAQVLAAALVHLPPALPRQRRAIATAYRRLAEAARGAPHATTLPAAAALDGAEATLASRGLFGRADVAALRALVDEGRRIRVSLAGLARIGARTGLMESVAAVLESVAARVEALDPTGGEKGVRGADSALEELAERMGATDGSSRAGLGRLAGQLRAAVGQSRRASEIHSFWTVQPRRPSASPASALVNWVRQRTDAVRSAADALRANATLGSPAGRHAVRMGLMVPAAFLISLHLPFQRGYWITLTAAVVLKADFATTFMRGFGRLAGTVAGAAGAGLVAAAVQPGEVASVMIIGLLAVAGFAVFQAGYAAGIGFVSALVVFLLDLVTPDSFGTAADRIVATLLGGAVALAVYRVWPTWSRDEVRSALVQLVQSVRDYAAAVMAPDSPESAVRDAARVTRLARTRAEAAVEGSLAEPARHRSDPDLVRAVIAELRRLVLATHLIRAEAAPEALPPELTEAVAQALDRLEDELGQALTRAEKGPALGPGQREEEFHPEPAAVEPGGRGPQSRVAALPPLREIQAGMDRSSPVWEGTDELVDAIGTLAAVVARSTDPAGREG